MPPLKRSGSDNSTSDESDNGAKKRVKQLVQARFDDHMSATELSNLRKQISRHDNKLARYRENQEVAYEYTRLLREANADKERKERNERKTKEKKEKEATQARQKIRETPLHERPAGLTRAGRSYSDRSDRSDSSNDSKVIIF